ncbi:MAG: M20 family metallopeptidase [Firmicutes bacterium]|nr:M20 family metallopeptidase [Bacillota bacterium]
MAQENAPAWNQFRVLEMIDPVELIRLTRDMVRIPSHPDYPGKEIEVAQFICDWLKREGLRAELQPASGGTRPNVVAWLKGQEGGRSSAPAGRTLMLNGHMDTVPPYSMDIDPFGGDVRDGRLYGRGSVDMKGALAAMMVALASIKRSGVPLGGDIVFTAVVDEELRGEGTEDVIKRGTRADGAIVGEPTELNLAAGHRGLDWLEITVHGRATHSGEMEKGINAISKAAKLIRAIEEEILPRFKTRGHSLLGLPRLNFGVIQGGTQPSTVADVCRIQIDRRSTPIETSKTIFEDFLEVFSRLSADDPDFRAEISRLPSSQATMDHLAFATPLEDPIVKSLSDAAMTVLGHEPPVVAFPAWSDGGLLAVHAGIPTVVFGPGSLGCAHSRVEWVEVDQLVAAARIYAVTACRFCSPAEAP